MRLAPFLRRAISSRISGSSSFGTFIVVTSDESRAAFSQIAYAYLSGAVHPGSRDVEQYLDVDSGGDVVGFIWGPADAMIPKLLVTSIETLSLALSSMETVFAAGDHSALHKQLVALGSSLT